MDPGQFTTRAMYDSARTLVPEGHTFVDEVLGIQKLLPDLQGCAYDMALRGVHFRRCLDAGLLPVVKQHKSDGAARDRFIENAKVAGGTRDRVEVQAVGAARAFASSPRTASGRPIRWSE